ncbi:MAG: ATPase, partial [Acutalibacteraceae bacterium]
MKALIKEKIEQGKTYLGIELGSTRIKACLIDDEFKVISSGSCEWENKFENGFWTYSLEDIHNG